MQPTDSTAARTGDPPRHPRHAWLTLGLFGVFALSLALYVVAEKRIDRTHEARLQVLQLTDELRHSRDDLTRMARSYVATADPIYREYYQEIRDILDGRRPRPTDYHHVYWDLVLPAAPRPGAPGAAVPWRDLIRQSRFAPSELAQLEEAKARSDSLANTELAAMGLLTSPEPVNDALRARAVQMLHDASYHQARAAVMRPIGQVQAQADQRTLAEVRSAENVALWVRTALVLVGAMLTALLWHSRRLLNTVLGSSVAELHARMASLGRGDFASAIPVAPGQENSVWGWLSETQINLQRIEVQRQAAEAKSQRLTQLYAALSQCNQAIVRCANEADLFNQICRIVVTFGGMKMAWIGTLDASSREIRPVAFFGAGTDYLTGLHISVDSGSASGRGPSGTAFRDDQPVWCQDFQHDPRTAPWHERGTRFGWGASAALPLHRDGSVMGVLTLYAEATQAFDEEARNLVLEMAMDIDHALGNFERESQRERAAAALRDSEQRLRTIIETEPECVKIVDANGRLVEMNPSGLAMLEADSLEQAQQHGLSSYILAPYRAPFTALHQRVMRGETGTLVFEIVGLKGARRWLETHAAPMRGTGGAPTMLLGITRDITERKQAEERAQYLAHFDALTGLPNRAQLDDRAQYAISLAQRSKGNVALMFLDLDHFKDINDTLGHSVGDALLIEVAQRLRLMLREEDTVSRLGGDEFIFLFHGIDAQHAAHLAQKLLHVIAEPYRVDAYDLNVSGSIGIALYPDDGKDLETLFKSADAAMYRAKQEGRRGYRFFTAEMQTRSARHLQLVNALRQALEHDQLRLHYQPQVSLGDGRLIGAEALLRWTHPELGPVSPAEFIPAAEDSGLILPIGEWVLRHAARQARFWMQDGLAPLVMAVNLSAVQFRQPDLPSLVARILEEESLPPEYLELELTEGVALHDPQGAIVVMNQLHERGVRMSIDDFGTGYSSLGHLKKFKVYKLKIDQSFVRDISTDAEDRAIVGAIVHMATSLGLQTIAEGVETAGQLAFLREQGCDEVQGYLFSRPLPADQFEQFVRSKAWLEPMHWLRQGPSSAV